MLDRSQQWDETDLNRLIQDKVEENISLEYKSAGALAMQDSAKREIAKDVSAFANSAGGVLVYGMKEEGRIPTNVDPVDPNKFTKEWIENVIISNVQPRIADLHINSVQLTRENVGRAAYVVTVPQSYTAHQAADHRYYKRFNFQSVPMEDYEVRDTMNRGRTPIIDVRFESRLAGNNRDSHQYQLVIFLDNKGAVAARTIKLVMGFPNRLNPEVGALINREPEYRGVGEYPLLKLWIQYSDIILFPSDSINMGNYGASLNFHIDNASFEFVNTVDPKIEWTIFADDMTPRRGRVRIADLIQF